MSSHSIIFCHYVWIFTEHILSVKGNLVGCAELFQVFLYCGHSICFYICMQIFTVVVLFVLDLKLFTLGPHTVLWLAHHWVGSLRVCLFYDCPDTFAATLQTSGDNLSANVCVCFLNLYIRVVDFSSKISCCL